MNKPHHLAHLTEQQIAALSSEEKQELYSQYRDLRYDAMMPRSNDYKPKKGRARK